MNNLQLLALWISLFIYVEGFNQTVYGVWEDQANSIYYFVSVDVATGQKTNLNVLSGVTGYVAPNTSTINTNDSTYIFRALTNGGLRIITVDIKTGFVLYDPVLNDNVIGLEYHCKNGSLYGIWEDSTGLYHFGWVDPVTATFGSVGTFPGMSGYVGGTFTLDVENGIYHFVGLNGPNFILYGIDVSNGNIIHNNVFPDNVHGIQYDCQTQQLYGRWEDNSTSTYYLVTVNPSLGSYTVVDSLSNITSGFVAEAYTGISDAGQYTFIGFGGPSILLISAALSDADIIFTHNIAYTNMAGMEAINCCDDSTVVPPAPLAQFSSNYSDTICEGDSITFIDQSIGIIGNRIWNFQGGSVAISNDSIVTVTYNTAGSFNLFLTVSNAGGSDDTLATAFIHVKDCMPVGNHSISPNSIHVYPNPAGNLLRFDLDIELDIQEIQILNAVGESVFQVDVESIATGINISRLPAGRYSILLRANTGHIFSKTFIKN